MSGHRLKIFISRTRLITETAIKLSSLPKGACLDEPISTIKSSTARVRVLMNFYYHAVLIYHSIRKCPEKLPNVQECNAADDDSINAVGLTITHSVFLNCVVFFSSLFQKSKAHFNASAIAVQSYSANPLSTLLVNCLCTVLPIGMLASTPSACSNTRFTSFNPSFKLKPAGW